MAATVFRYLKLLLIIMATLTPKLNKILVHADYTSAPAADQKFEIQQNKSIILVAMSPLFTYARSGDIGELYSL